MSNPFGERALGKSFAQDLTSDLGDGLPLNGSPSFQSFAEILVGPDRQCRAHEYSVLHRSTPVSTAYRRRLRSFFSPCSTLRAAPSPAQQGRAGEGVPSRWGKPPHRGRKPYPSGTRYTRRVEARTRRLQAVPAGYEALPREDESSPSRARRTVRVRPVPGAHGSATGRTRSTPRGQGHTAAGGSSSARALPPHRVRDRPRSGRTIPVTCCAR